jgi:hypothetical protein
MASREPLAGDLAGYDDALEVALYFMEQAAHVRPDNPWSEVLWTNAELWLTEAAEELKKAGIQ